MTSGISLAEIENGYHAEQMRACRNQVRSYMTHNTAEILPAEQAEWYAETYLPARKAGELFGYIVRDEDDMPLGYGLISKRDGRWWVSGGLIADARGKGAGHFLFQEMTMMIHEDLRSEEAWLDVLNENEAARSLYEKLGYVAVSSTDLLTVMVHRQIHEEAMAA